MQKNLYGLIPHDVRQPFDVREVIARIVDGSLLMNLNLYMAPL